jgi:hypothetical protein
VGFYVRYPFCKKTTYLRENWFIAVKNPHNYIILHWKHAFMRILNESIENNGIKNSKTWKETNKEYIPFFMKEYLSMHVANLWCIQNDNNYRQMYKKTVYLYNANSTALMSFSLIKGLGYKSNFPLIKFTSFDIKILDLSSKKLLQNVISNKLKNILKKYLNYENKNLNDDWNWYIYIILVLFLIIKINKKNKN